LHKPIKTLANKEIYLSLNGLAHHDKGYQHPTKKTLRFH